MSEGGAIGIGLGFQRAIYIQLEMIAVRADRHDAGTAGTGMIA